MKRSDFKTEIKSIAGGEGSTGLMATIASVRKSKNLTQEQLVRKANVTQAQVASIESFSYTPSLATMFKILGGLEMDIALFDRESNRLSRLLIASPIPLSRL